MTLKSSDISKEAKQVCNETLPLHVLPNPHVEVANASAYQETRMACSIKKFSVLEGNRWPMIDLTTPSRKLKAIAELRPDPEKEPYLTDMQLALWQKRMGEYVMAMDDLTADVMDIISAKWLRKAEQWQDMVAVTADDFLQMRAIQKHKSGTGRLGGYMEEQRREISCHLSILSNTWITVMEMEIIELTNGKKGTYRKRTSWAGRSRAILVDTVKGQMDDLEGFKPYSWDVRPGGVFARFLFGPGRQTALLSQRALEYDPYYQKWEKRLTRYLSYQWRIRQGTKSYFQPFTVETILKGIGETVDTKHPIRTKKRLEKAWNRLRKDGIIGSWRYETGIDESIVGKKGWWKAWLEWKVIIEPPKEIIEQYAKIKNPEEKLLPC